jgi:phytoene synthase
MSQTIGLPLAAAAPDELESVRLSVAKAKTSFYTAMRILPQARRDAMYAIYAFCREVDDIADEPAPIDAKHRALEQWRSEIATLYTHGTPSLPVARALAGPITAFGLLRSDFDAVIDGMQMDADTDIRGPSLAELDLYCARVAGAVGRLSMRIFGPWEPEADAVADHLGRALQLTNILRDLDEDAARGRLYLPRELLQRHAIDSDDPTAVLKAASLPVVCADLAAIALQHFADSAAAMRRCRRRTMRPARMMGGIYRATLERLIQRGWSPPRQPVRLSKLTKLSIALRQFL